MTGTRKRHKSKKIRLTVPDRIYMGCIYTFLGLFFPLFVFRFRELIPIE